jgi:hypothetical protein
MFLAILGIAACRLPAFNPAIELAPPMPAVESLAHLGHDVRRLELADIDLRSCAGGFGATNALAADFDGDGRSDSAVLVAFDISPETTEWRGQKLRQATIAVVVVFGSATTPRFEVVQQHDGFLPAGVVLDLVPPGRYKLDGEAVTLDRPSLGVGHCEKSAAIYTWRSGNFVLIPVSD